MGVEIAHVRDWRIPIVERVAFSNDQPSSFLIKCRSVCRGMIPLQRLDIRAEYQLIRWPYPLDSKKCKTRLSSPSGRPLASSIGKASFATSLVRGASPVGASSSHNAQASRKAPRASLFTASRAPRAHFGESMEIIVGLI